MDRTTRSGLVISAVSNLDSKKQQSTSNSSKPIFLIRHLDSSNSTARRLEWANKHMKRIKSSHSKSLSVWFSKNRKSRKKIFTNRSKKSRSQTDDQLTNYSSLLNETISTSESPDCLMYESRPATTELNESMPLGNSLDASIDEASESQSQRTSTSRSAPIKEQKEEEEEEEEEEETKEDNQSESRLVEHSFKSSSLISNSARNKEEEEEETTKEDNQLSSRLVEEKKVQHSFKSSSLNSFSKSARNKVSSIFLSHRYSISCVNEIRHHTVHSIFTKSSFDALLRRTFAPRRKKSAKKTETELASVDVVDEKPEGKQSNFALACDEPPPIETVREEPTQTTSEDLFVSSGKSSFGLKSERLVRRFSGLEPQKKYLLAVNLILIVLLLIISSTLIVTIFKGSLIQSIK